MQTTLFGTVPRVEPQLRPYQVEAVERVHARIAAGVRRILLVAATGAGKTTVASELIRQAARRHQRALFLAHRRELIQQAYARLLDFGFAEHEVGILMASDRRRRPGAAVQVASVDTLRHRAKPRAELVIVDECHRALAKTYRDIAEHYRASVHLGLTATPYRADGRGLGDAYDELVVVASPRQLIAEGFLVEPRVFTVPPSALPDLSAVRTSRGDYEAGALAEAVDRQALVGNLVEHWSKHAAGIRTVVFATSVAHSNHIAERFRAAGVAAEHLDGETPTHERDAILARLESGETRVVASIGTLTEGWDQPAVKCAILARPTKSTGLYLQMAGRILRPYQGQQAIILDHAGCVLEHGLPQDDREFSLESRPKKKTGQMSAPVKTCPECFAVVALSTRECPSCGATLSTPREDVEETAEELVEVTPDDVRRIEWQRLTATAAIKGYNPGWAVHRFREKFGEAPSPSIRTCVPLSPEEQRRAVYDSIAETEPNSAWACVRYRVETGERAPSCPRG
jgi:superfamily II DNA or RNA helicase